LASRPEARGAADAARRADGLRAPPRRAGRHAARPPPARAAPRDRRARVNPSRRLIVSGDDFGVAEEVNEGIIRSPRDGTLGQTSSRGPAAPAAHAAALAKGPPSLAVGLPLVLAQGRPVSPPKTIPELVRADGAFHDTPIRNGLRYAWAYVRDAGR